MELPQCRHRGREAKPGFFECGSTHLIHNGTVPASVCALPCPYADKENFPERASRGIGDTVAKITKATGIDRLARLYSQLSGRDCGCEKRRKALNDLFPYGGEKVQTWAVGMTTAPREQPTVEASLQSVRNAGWNAIEVFSDADRIGAWNNFRYGLARLVELNPDADAYLMLQDDIQMSRHLREHLEATLWPMRKPRRIGVCSLYCPTMHHRAKRGWFPLKKVEHSYGALAYVFPPPSAQLLVGLTQSKIMPEATVDLKVGRFCRNHDLQYLIHSPSFIRHTGETSTISRRGMTGSRQCLEFIEDATA